MYLTQQFVLDVHAVSYPSEAVLDYGAVHVLTSVHVGTFQIVASLVATVRFYDARLTHGLSYHVM